GALGLPVCATASISAAAFFTSATELEGLRAVCLIDVAIAFAATGTWFQSRSASSVHDHAATPISASMPAITSVAARIRQRSQRVSTSTTGESAKAIIIATNSGMKNGAPQ